ncbi:MAG: thiamine phosphate synthase [Planctomycetes bacterium]|nr:thiamine phosphate synthase [Planctomycetota bacterium]
MSAGRTTRSAYRAIDANANRCREGLRVAEDYARFILDNERLAGALKNLRHSVTAAVREVGSDASIVASRDTESDVGTRITLAPEVRRAGEEDILKSALKRSEEALRVLEEFTKLVSPANALRFQDIRYRLYTVEQELLSTWLPWRRLSSASLYFVLAPAAGSSVDIERTVRGAVEGGVDIVGFAESSVPDDRFLHDASLVRDACAAAGVPCIIASRPDVAVAVDADGVHLGPGDMSLDAARRVAGNARAVGISVTDAGSALKAQEAGATYVSIGVCWDFDVPVDTGCLERAAAELTVPWFAAGGIEVEDVPGILAAGATRIVVGKAISIADDPARAAAAFRKALAL